MIDSHCHLDQEPLFYQVKELLNRSKKIGITKLLKTPHASIIFLRS